MLPSIEQRPGAARPRIEIVTSLRVRAGSRDGVAPLSTQRSPHAAGFAGCYSTLLPPRIKTLNVQFM
jgi:hypothetical protein